MSTQTKPRVVSRQWRLALTDGPWERRWHVEFTDSCGCDYEEYFASHATALRFAHHIAAGGSRWEFTE